VILFNGLVNGAFYALLSLGLAIVFGVMRVVNFAHGAFYMLGAFAAYLLLQQAGLPFWPALIVAPAAVGVVGAVCERLLLRRLYGLDALYNFLLTFGLTIFIQDAMPRRLGIQGQPYPMPAALAGVLAAPMRNVSPLMGSELIILTFAVVVIGGLGSIVGAIAAGFLAGILGSLGAIFDPAIENVVVFALMAVVLLVRPAGLF